MPSNSIIKKFVFTTLAIGLCCIAFQNGSAQQVKTQTFTFNSDSEGGMFMLSELGGIIIESNDSLVIDMIMEPQNRMEEYKNVDLQEGDIIRMANAKKVETAEELQGIYDALKVGEDLKLGIIREGRMKIVSLRKGAPEKMPKKMQVMTVGAGGPGQPAGGNVEMEVVAGMLLTIIGSKIVVADMIEGITPKFEGPEPTDGDEIFKLNGKKVNSSKSLRDTFQSIPIGEKVELTFLRNGKEQKTSFIRPEEQDLKMMQQPSGN